MALPLCMKCMIGADTVLPPAELFRHSRVELCSLFEGRAPRPRDSNKKIHLHECL